MKTTFNLFQFSEPTPVAEEGNIEHDIVAQTDNKFQLDIFLFILRQSKSKTFNLFSANEESKFRKNISAYATIN